MSYFQRLRQKLFVAILLGGTWLAMSSSAWAAANDTHVETGSASPWVFPYFLVIVSIGLGLAVACNPSRRREKAKPEDYQQKKLV